MLEIGCAARTTFVGNYLQDRDLQREIGEGLNGGEAWEMTVLCLRILQAALVMVNVLLPQDALAESEWVALLTPPADAA